MPPLTIRNATPADLEACLQLESRCFEPSEAASIERIAIRIREYAQGFLVAELDGRIVGQVNSGATDQDDIGDEEFKALIGHDPAGRNLVIFSLAVLPEHRRQGVADELMQRFIALARRMGKSRILLLCKDGLVGYYQRLGFVDLGPSASSHGGFSWREMGLRLD